MIPASHIFDQLPEHKKSNHLNQGIQPPQPGDCLSRMTVVRTKCVDILAVLRQKIILKRFPKEINIIPHPKSILACWVVETKPNP